MSAALKRAIAATTTGRLGRGAAPDPDNAGSAAERTAGVGRLFDRIDQLVAIAEIFPGGIAMFDQDLSMVVCNSRLREMLDYPDALFANGNPAIEQLFRFNAERGEYGPGDVEEHVRHPYRPGAPARAACL